MATVEAGKGETSVSIDRDVAVAESGWLAVRAGGPPHPDHPGPTLYGHTSPVYLDVPGKPVVREGRRRVFPEVDRPAGFRRSRSGTGSPRRSRPHVKEQLDAARAVYRRLVQGTGP